MNSFGIFFNIMELGQQVNPTSRSKLGERIINKIFSTEKFSIQEKYNKASQT